MAENATTKQPADLALGESARIAGFAGERAELERRLEGMGLIAGEELKLLRVAPLGDPMELQVRDTRIILRKREAASIRLQTP